MDSTSLYEIWQARSGLKAGGTLLQYVPPDMKWTSSSGIHLPEGRYFKVGSRSKQQYDLKDARGDYWDLSSAVDVVIDSVPVDGNWYSFFMTGTGPEDFMVLPFMRIYNWDYDVTNVGKSTVTIGDSDVAYWDTQVEQAGYVSSNDEFNGYRVRRWPNDLTEVWGCSTAVIEDTVNDTSDLLVFDDNQGFTAGEALQLLPPAGTPHLYLGSLWVDGSGNIRWFLKRGWRTYWRVPWTIAGYASAKIAGNSFLQAVPPPAHKVWFTASHDQSTTYANGMYSFFLSGDSGSDLNESVPYGANMGNSWAYHNYRTQYKRNRQPIEFNLTNNQTIRNCFAIWDSTWQASANAYMYIGGYKE